MLDTIWSKINETFIIGDRYRFFLEGLKNTLMITFVSFICGTLIGIAICAARRSKYPWLRKAAQLLVAFFTGVPTTMLLMIFVYVIFGRSALPVLWIVTVGLTFKAGAYLSAIFGSALDTVESGEVEAARTLGMNAWQAFKYVALPQTVKAAMPLYKNQFVMSMQETSVAGYLAVVDLTRAASIVQSRTLDAFFGLFTVTLVYFVIGGIIKSCFKQVEDRIGSEAK